MSLLSAPDTTRFSAYGPRHLDQLADRFGIDADLAETMRIISLVLPFRVNAYVLSELIDWSRIPDDPMFQLVFPQPGMLDATDERLLRSLVADQAGRGRLADAVRHIRAGLNPHPSGQRELNVPRLDGRPLAGVQHKYRETVLYFPGQGQTCHAYCTYCFRWAQFVGDADLRFAAPDPAGLVAYLAVHPEVSDVLLTGGDPMVMSTDRLRAHLEPLLRVPTVSTVRIGTKAPAYWPDRFVADPDADPTLRLFEQVVASGRTLAVMAHFSHPRELATAPAKRAVARIRDTGAVVYCQAPLIARVNDDPDVWTALWRAELAAGAVPYYQFIARDTGPHDYFAVPLRRAADIFRRAYRTLPGLARSVRGPVMSAEAGKVVIDGDEDGWLQLRFLQARDPALVARPFRAWAGAGSSWLDQLRLDPDTPEDIAAAVTGSWRTTTAEDGPGDD